MLHRTTATLNCGCRVHYIFNDEEHVDNRLHEPVTEDCDRLPWTIDPEARVRKGCGDHWHEDHHEHFRRICTSNAPDYWDHEPGIGMRTKLP